MQFWLTTANLKVVEKAAKMGIVSGITTNPTIVARSGMVLEDLIEKLLSAQPGPVGVQVTSNKSEEMVVQGEALYHFSNRIAVKIPVTVDGLPAIRALSQKKIPVIATTIIDPSQLMLAVHAGASYLAPHYSKMCDEEANGVDSMKLMLHFLRHYGFDAKIIASAIRSKEQIMQCAMLGIHAVTLDEKIFEEWAGDHPTTKAALERFSQDWKQAKERRSLPL